MSALPELDALIDDVASGRKVLPFVPGTWAFSATVALFAATLGVLGGLGRFAFERLLSADASSDPTIALIVLPLGAPLVLGATFLTAKGYPSGYRLFLGIANSLLVASGLLVAFLLVEPGQPPTWTVLLALVPISLASLLLRSSSYRLFVEFQQRMRVQRMKKQKQKDDARRSWGLIR